MQVNAQAIQTIYTGFRVLANQAMSAAQPQYQRVATVIPSRTKQEDYGWLGSLSGMREWIGDRIIQNLSNHGFTIKNRSFEQTVGIDKDDIDDDTYGVYRPLIQMLSDDAAMFPDQLVFSLFKSGFTNLCYDGQYYFDTDHREDGGPVQSNKGTYALNPVSYGLARAQIMGLKKPNGDPYRLIPDLLVVGPQNDSIGRRILFAEQINGTSNEYQKTAELMMVPELGTEWFLLCTKKPIKPFIFQERKRPEFVALDNPTDEDVFKHKKILYGIDMRCNAGFGLWQLAFGSTGVDTPPTQN